MTTVVTAPTGVHANARPYLYGTELDAIARALEHGQYGHGPETETFERNLAAYLGVPDIVAVGTGTAALHLALHVAGVGPGDEVIVPSLTFCASVHAIRATGAVPRFVDVDPATLCVTPAQIQHALTPATRAVMPVLYGGRAVDLGDTRRLLDQRGIVVVEDAAHAFGSRTATVRVGATGVLTCFSFDAIKSLTCGDGGAVVPRTTADATALRQARLLGMTTAPQHHGAAANYTVAGLGLRYHLSTLNAAIGQAQLDRFPEMEQRRRDLWRTYRRALHSLTDVVMIDLDVERTVPFNCVVRVPARHRDTVHAALRAQGIAVGVHYPPNHQQPAFQRWTRPLPATDTLGAEILSLPFHPDLTADDIHIVADALQHALATSAASAPAGLQDSHP